MPAITTENSPHGREFVILETPDERAKGWSVSSADLGLATAAFFTIRKQTLHGGRQEGVELIEVDQGVLKLTIIPTRGMSLYKVFSGEIELGWSSPVKEIVNPAYVELESRGGLGWLDGFNEFLVRCGVEWCGHPGMDNGRLLTLHGRVANIPATDVRVTIEEAPPHRIRVGGRVSEQTFKFADYELWAEVSTEPGKASFQISDTLTNRSDYEREFQLLYHANFGPPLLEQGARLVAAVKQVAPLDDYAGKSISTWSEYLGPTKNFGEHVFLLVPFTRPEGTTMVMLKNAAGERGVRVDYETKNLPYFSLWKNTDTMKEGYVTGLEPSTSYPYNRSVERKAGRVPKLAAGASKSFEVGYQILFTKAEVDAVEKEIVALQAQRPTTIESSAENMKAV